MDIAGLLSYVGSEYLFWVLPFLFVLSVVVFFHELGHFLVARWCGVTVKVFSVGFGREIFGFYDRHGTRWRVAWIPLGGYVKFLDDENVASVPDKETRDSLASDQTSGSFHNKPLGQRAAVVAAGPIANFLLAIVIFAFMFTFIGQRFTEPVIDVAQPSVGHQAGLAAGDRIISINGSEVESFEEIQRIVGVSSGTELTFQVRRGSRDIEIRIPPATDNSRNFLGLRRYTIAQVDSVQEGSPADKAGFLPGDVVIQIDGKPIETFGQLQQIVSVSAGKELEIIVRRNGQQKRLKATPESRAISDGQGNTVTRGLLGIRRSNNPGGAVWKRHDPLTAVWLGSKQTWFVISSTMSYLYKIISGRESADQLGGPIRIAKISGDVAKAGFLPLINLAAILSVSIGLLNLFPIPMLDGGYLLFYTIEAIRGRPLSDRAQEIGFRIGLALVLMLMIFATWNDLRLS